MPSSRPTRGRPRYRELADELTAAIASGELAVGQHLPGEHELVATHGVSRYTVREALRLLEEKGLIGRRRGIGTVVTSSKGSTAYVHSIRSPVEMLQYPESTRLHIRRRERIETDRDLARLLGCETGEAWLRLGGVRTGDGDAPPLGWTDVYLRPEFADVEPQIGTDPRPVYALVEEAHGLQISDVRVELSAGRVPDEHCEALGCEAGEPSLRILRRYYDGDGRLFEVSVSEHPGDRFTYAFALARGWQADAAEAADQTEDQS